MTIYQMRAAIASVYSGEKWKQKVRDMPEDQIIAVYYSFLENGRFDSKPKSRETGKKSCTDEPFKPVEQLKINI